MGYRKLIQETWTVRRRYVHDDVEKANMECKYYSIYWDWEQALCGDGRCTQRDGTCKKYMYCRKKPHHITAVIEDKIMKMSDKELLKERDLLESSVFMSIMEYGDMHLDRFVLVIEEEIWLRQMMKNNDPEALRLELAIQLSNEQDVLSADGVQDNKALGKAREEILRLRIWIGKWEDRVLIKKYNSEHDG